MHDSIDVTHIVPVYTKRDYLPDTVASLLHQDTHLTREFIFLDDNSKDDSVAVLRECTKGIANVTIVTNLDNKGPSVRLNQGAVLAKGKYLHFLDHDDIVPKNAIQIMFDTLTHANVDFIYGTWQKTGKPGKELLDWRVPEPVAHTISYAPLEMILTGRFKRMCTLVKRELFLEAGGCDEQVFIQDESLPIRLAMKAKSMVKLDAVVNLVPIEIGNLSQNKSQLNHDRFLAYYDALKEYPDCLERYRRLMYRRAVSAGWKETRDTQPLAWLKPVFWRYLFTFWYSDQPQWPVLEKLYQQFHQLATVRRVSR